MSHQHLFQNLVEAFHQDASSDLVNDLAMRFTADTARRIYKAKRHDVKLVHSASSPVART